MNNRPLPSLRDKYHPCNSSNTVMSTQVITSLASLHHPRKKLPTCSLLLVMLALSACGWVDSTGQNDSDAPFSVSPATSGAGSAESGGAFTELPGTRVVQLSELGSLRIEPDAQLRSALSLIHI